MAKTRAGSRVATPDGRRFSERLYGIREVHIEVESILQSLAALQDDIPCASCTSVCCKEAMCRESLDSDFLRFLLGPLVEGYSVDVGWHVAGSGCRLSYGRPLVCYEYFCERFEAQQRAEARQLSRAFKTLYADAFAGQHMLVVEDIGRITASKLDRIHARLESLREAANAALRRVLCGKLGLQPAAGPAARAERERPA
ncbi:hypothetical protein [Thiobacillus sp. 65-1402]|uniref:hypothetical protein n=1 Tax=Thiobacillus sp. 65-1402 TaxID=1895861 RepID=UPI0025E06D80|nr:hypothetical protein [Thiobacillus sp. 65-1402]